MSKDNAPLQAWNADAHSNKNTIPVHIFYFNDAICRLLFAQPYVLKQYVYKHEG